MSTPMWTFCEVCGGPMHWQEETIGKYNPVTGTPEMYSYYECAIDVTHQPKAAEAGETTAYIGRKLVKVRVPEQPKR